MVIFLLACTPVVELFEVALSGSVSSTTEGPVALELAFGWVGDGSLRRPYGIIAEKELEGAGELDWTLAVPTDGGEGLLLYGWQDLDRDGLYCGLGAAEEPAGLVELGEVVHQVEVTLVLDQPCAAPEALFP